MDLLIISLTALLGSALTFFSGFGLGTLLLPVFALFFPLELAVALTAVVHFLNNIFKLVLLGRHADRKTILKFGLPSFFASLFGAWLLTRLGDLQTTVAFSILGYTGQTSYLKLIMGVILLFFALFELIPALRLLQIHSRYLTLGGLLSGFFGGLSGNQGALRSAFLLKAGLTKEIFIATGVVIACMVDVARLGVYYPFLSAHPSELPLTLLLAACLSAFAGAFAGSKLIKKVTVKSVQYLVAVCLILFSCLLMAGKI
jgi:uncharacterized membrane protein YfcA